MIDTSRIDLNKDQLMDELRRHIGRDEGIHMRDLISRVLNTVLVEDAAERKARELITALRNEGHPICAHPASGYYLAANQQELDATCAFLLERSQSTVDQVCAMKGVLPVDLYHQLGVTR